MGITESLRSIVAPLTIARAAIVLQDEILPRHPDLLTGHTVNFPDLYPGADRVLSVMPSEQSCTPEIQRRNFALGEQIKLKVNESRSRIVELAKEATYETISYLSNMLQLSDKHLSVPPRIVCSDFVDQKVAWSDGIEDGFYPLGGSFFMCRGKLPERVDYRVRYSLGPVIHYSTEDLKDRGLVAVVEESLHYLEWFYTVDPSIHERIIRWRAVNEADLELRKFSLDTAFERELIPFKLHSHGILLPPRREEDPLGSEFSAYFSIGSKQLTFNESFAAGIISEACAEFFRLHLGVSEAHRNIYELIDAWEERGLSGWTHLFRESDDQPATALGLFNEFFDSSVSDLLARITSLNKCEDLRKLCQISVMVNQGHQGAFPSDIVHFLGYALGQELYRSVETTGEAGLQEMSLRIFSYLHSPEDRLESLKEMVR